MSDAQPGRTRRADGPDVLPLEELLRLLTASQEPLAAALGSATPDDLDRVRFALTYRPWETGQPNRLFKPKT